VSHPDSHPDSPPESRAGTAPRAGNWADTAVLAVATLILLGVTAWCLVHGIRFGSSTGGLLLAPVRQVRIEGGWIVGATAAATAAVLVAVWAVLRRRARLGH
jgi:hypothetical protein